MDEAVSWTMTQLSAHNMTQKINKYNKWKD